MNLSWIKILIIAVTAAMCVLLQFELESLETTCSTDLFFFPLLFPKPCGWILATLLFHLGFWENVL